MINPLPAARATTWVALALAGVLACSPEAAVRSSRDRDVPLGRTLLETVVLGDEPGGVAFVNVRGYATDGPGRLWVAEWDALIHLFEPDGRHVGTWERKGRGPGEFQVVSAFDVDPVNQRLVVRDGLEMVVLTTDLEHVARWPAPLFRLGAGTMGGVRFHPERAGLLFPVAIGQDSVAVGDHRLVWSHGLLLETSFEGELRDTVAELVGSLMRRFPVPIRPDVPTFGPPLGSMLAPSAGNAVWLPIPGVGLVVGDGHHTYRMHLVSPAGDTLRRFERDLPREVLAVAEGPAGVDFRDGPEMTRGFVQQAAYDRFRQEILFCRPPAQGRGPLDPIEVDHFDLEGAYLGTLDWPACPRHVGPDGTLWTHGPDALGVITVRGFRYREDG